jgi:mRNA-degrading endonuclease toxin of MazEF toxin-antitoxin module
VPWCTGTTRVPEAQGSSCKAPYATTRLGRATRAVVRTAYTVWCTAGAAVVSVPDLLRITAEEWLALPAEKALQRIGSINPERVRTVAEQQLEPTLAHTLAHTLAPTLAVALATLTLTLLAVALATLTLTLTLTLTRWPSSSS